MWSNAVGTILFLFLCTDVSSALKRPHIVFILADDLGWNDVSLHGSKQIPTPNIDAIARDGILLNQYYVQPLCSPSRGCLMTGKYAIGIGFQHGIIRNNAPWGLPLEEKIIPQYLKVLGYKTHAIGKWHLGYFKEEYLPLNRGFDTFFGYYNPQKDYFTHFSHWENAKGLDLHENWESQWKYKDIYSTDLFTAKAKEIIENHDTTQPLFLYFAEQAVHSGNFDDQPLQAPNQYVNNMVGIDDEKRQIFGGMVSALDYSVGEIFTALEKFGMLNDTVFVFSSDNGGAPREKEGTSSSNWPLKGSKFNLWEGGVRVVSFVWSHLLRQRSRIFNGLMHISDWLPTLLSAAGGPEALKMLPENIDGVNQWPSLMNFQPFPRSEVLLNIDDVAEVAGIRKGRYKLVKGSYFDGIFDKWYDPEGKSSNATSSIQTATQEALYSWNYLRLLERSNAARILWNKYDKSPRLSAFCSTEGCEKELNVNCGMPPPLTPTCNAEEKEPCLYDIISDPCEYYNIAKELPEVTAELERAIDKHRAYAVQPGGKKGDPNSNPKLHGNVWLPWR